MREHRIKSTNAHTAGGTGGRHASRRPEPPSWPSERQPWAQALFGQDAGSPWDTLGQLGRPSGRTRAGRGPVLGGHGNPGFFSSSGDRSPVLGGHGNPGFYGSPAPGAGRDPVFRPVSYRGGVPDSRTPAPRPTPSPSQSPAADGAGDADDRRRQAFLDAVKRGEPPDSGTGRSSPVLEGPGGGGDVGDRRRNFLDTIKRGGGGDGGDRRRNFLDTIKRGGGSERQGFLDRIKRGMSMAREGIRGLLKEFMGRARNLNFRQGGKVPGYWGTCGLASIQNLLRMHTGRNVTEREVVNFAIRNRLCFPGGGTISSQWPKIMKAFGLKAREGVANLNEMARHLMTGRGLELAVDAGVLWSGGRRAFQGLNHAIAMLGVKTSRGSNGKARIDGFYIADSGGVDARRGVRFVSWNQMLRAIGGRRTYVAYVLNRPR